LHRTVTRLVVLALRQAEGEVLVLPAVAGRLFFPDNAGITGLQAIILETIKQAVDDLPGRVLILGLDRDVALERDVAVAPLLEVTLLQRDIERLELRSFVLGHGRFLR